MLYEKPANEIQRTENEIFLLVQKLERLHKDTPPRPVKNYVFNDLSGTVSLLDLFADKEVLFAIHNMGQGCRYCTLWADGINGFVPHLEDRFAVALLSKDSPDVQRRFANSRGWRFRMASHAGGEYLREQSSSGENSPGLACYVRKGDQIFKKSSAQFAPGDLFCPQWHILSLAGIGMEEWTPQFGYWNAPDKLDDGGANVR
jgi:predicted dithiol-disulfide oxidoreductase (DUF899 family)